VTEPAIALRGASVVFGDVRALDGVDLGVAPGELVAVTGHSGAGKTTLLGAVAGLVRLAAGTASVAGETVRDRDQTVALGVAVIPQGNALAATLTAYENVLVPLLAAGVDREEAERRAVTALAEVGLEDSRGHLVEELSGGQQQRVAVARGLALATPVLLADEPTSELDHDNRERVLGLLRVRAAAGAAVVMTTNDLEAAAQADRVLALDDGRLG
jgi:putative ABC transport system ATP-binding protein